MLLFFGLFMYIYIFYKDLLVLHSFPNKGNCVRYDCSLGTMASPIHQSSTQACLVVIKNER